MSFPVETVSSDNTLQVGVPMEQSGSLQGRTAEHIPLLQSENGQLGLNRRLKKSLTIALAVAAATIPAVLLVAGVTVMWGNMQASDPDPTVRSQSPHTIEFGKWLMIGGVPFGAVMAVALGVITYVKQFWG